MISTAQAALAGFLIGGAGLGYGFWSHSKGFGPTASAGVVTGDPGMPAADAKPRSQHSRDVEITRRIRRDIEQDTHLSTYAHNVKIYTENGKVVLLGPVRSEWEKKSVEAKAEAVAGPANVNGKLDVVD